MYRRWERVLKRGFDVGAAGTGLVVTAPLLVGLAAMVKLSSPGPVLFRQTRVGRHGQPFVMVKFRTMRAGGDGPQVTAAGDSRITRVGRVLRRTKLDELPELLNVLRGDMSLVGPRPEVPRYVAIWPDGLRARILSVRPGITDPATVRFRHEEDLLAGADDPHQVYVDEVLPIKLGLYVDYLDHASFRSDLGVLVETVVVILRG